MRVVICAVIIQNSRILLVKKRRTWILPGGKPEQGESDFQCLFREIGEEVPEVTVGDFRFYKSFEGRTPHRGDIIEAKVYFADIEAGTAVELEAGAEVSAVKWAKHPKRHRLSEITEKIVNFLCKDGYL